MSGVVNSMGGRFSMTGIRTGNPLPPVHSGLPRPAFPVLQRYGFRVVDYVGIPLSGQVGQYARSNYPVLSRWGPNDGLTLLGDALVPGSLTIVAFGRDHFVAEDPQIDAKSVALMRVMARLAEGEIARGCPGR